MSMLDSRRAHLESVSIILPQSTASASTEWTAGQPAVQHPARGGRVMRARGWSSHSITANCQVTARQVARMYLMNALQYTCAVRPVVPGVCVGQRGIAPTTTHLKPLKRTVGYRNKTGRKLGLRWNPRKKIQNRILPGPCDDTLRHDLFTSLLVPMCVSDSQTRLVHGIARVDAAFGQLGRRC